MLIYLVNKVSNFLSMSVAGWKITVFFNALLIYCKMITPHGDMHKVWRDQPQLNSSDHCRDYNTYIGMLLHFLMEIKGNEKLKDKRERIT